MNPQFYGLYFVVTFSLLNLHPTTKSYTIQNISTYSSYYSISYSKQYFISTTEKKTTYKLLYEIKLVQVFLFFWQTEALPTITYLTPLYSFEMYIG